jgi:hypothetical protein
MTATAEQIDLANGGKEIPAWYQLQAAADVLKAHHPSLTPPTPPRRRR